MVSLYQVRSIFLLVRGVDRTGAMFTQMGKNMDKTIQKEMAMERAFGNLIFAGAALMTFGSLLAMSIGKILDMSSLGALYVEDFARVLERLGIAVSEYVIKHFQWFLDWGIQFLAGLDEMRIGMGQWSMSALEILTVIGVFLAGALILGGIVLIITGAYHQIMAVLILFNEKVLLSSGIWQEFMWKLSSMSQLHTTTYALFALARAVFAVVGGFYLGWEAAKWLVNVFGEVEVGIAGLIIALTAVVLLVWQLAAGAAIASSGVAVLLGLAAFGVGMAAFGMNAYFDQFPDYDDSETAETSMKEYYKQQGLGDELPEGSEGIVSAYEEALDDSQETAEAAQQMGVPSAFASLEDYLAAIASQETALDEDIASGEGGGIPETPTYDLDDLLAQSQPDYNQTNQTEINVDVNLNFDSINTKASTEELEDIIRESVGKAFDFVEGGD